MVYLRLDFILKLLFCSRSTILVELSADQLSYKAGDHLGIFPCNQPAMVKGQLIFNCVFVSCFDYIRNEFQKCNFFNFKNNIVPLLDLIERLHERISEDAVIELQMLEQKSTPVGVLNGRN